MSLESQVTMKPFMGGRKCSVTFLSHMGCYQCHLGSFQSVCFYSQLHIINAAQTLML